MNCGKPLPPVLREGGPDPRLLSRYYVREVERAMEGDRLSPARQRALLRLLLGELAQNKTRPPEQR